ncbi:AbgT family transporter [Alkalicoccobacillus murimartini]|uniref:Aminobenzoyl-glutamate transport protein n=1 Tax=Alkalicoccobacillus murimartini TaxID=171685 RepID=A0ABT9YIG2_9BACI|nr:AbgT family transporter [Alkalicoccobacillus murimartini]MDQ0207617.1 aminobenzoyl-glutamate transport protein [Alkalicoccobacillus murimartini]
MKNIGQKSLLVIEKIGNKLPEPLTIFLLLIGLLFLSSTAFQLFGVTVSHPSTMEETAIKGLLSREGIEYIATSLVSNFVQFTPLGIVITMMLGIGLAERVGLLETFIKKMMLSAPVWMIPYMIFFAGNFATVATDSAFLIVPPLAGIIYYSLKMNPLAGIITGFAGVSSGYATGILITANEPLLAGITNEAIAILGSDVTVSPISNYYFMVAGVIICTLIGGTITRKITEPRLGVYHGDQSEEVKPVTKEETAALRVTGIVAAIYLAILAVLIFIPNSPLRNEAGGLLPSPLLDGLVTFLLLFFFIIGLTYGMKMKRIRSMNDIGRYMGESVSSMKNFIVLVFFIAQFTAFFQWTGIGLWLSVTGAETLTSLGFTGIGAIVCFIIFTSIINMVISSGSGLWAIFAPIFIPMFMQLGYHPGFIQMAYRIGDSSTSMISPLLPYMVVILEFLRRWDKKMALGTLISYTLPYSIAILIGLTLLFVVFYLIGIPIGPDVDIFLP